MKRMLMTRLTMLLSRQGTSLRSSSTRNQPPLVRRPDLSPGATLPTRTGPTTPTPTPAICSCLADVERVETAIFLILRPSVIIYVLKSNVYFDFKISLLYYHNIKASKASSATETISKLN